MTQPWHKSRAKGLRSSLTAVLYKGEFLHYNDVRLATTAHDRLVMYAYDGSAVDSWEFITLSK